jgi:hypothetical protein
MGKTDWMQTHTDYLSTHPNIILYSVSGSKFYDVCLFVGLKGVSFQGYMRLSTNYFVVGIKTEASLRRNDISMKPDFPGCRRAWWYKRA